MKIGRSFLFLTLLNVFLSSCSDNRWQIDTSSIRFELRLSNIDSLFINCESEQCNEIHNNLIESFGMGYIYEFSMNLQLPKDSISGEKIKAFYASEYVNALEEEKAKLKIDLQLNELKGAFKRMKFFFEEKDFPTDLVYMNRLFSGIQIVDSVIWVSLENYLDASLPIIKQIPNEQLYQWQKDRMNLNFLARDIVQLWIQTSLFKEADEHLVYHMVQAGKVIYILHVAFPDRSLAHALRYSDEEFEWAEKNETAFWEYLVREEMLFKNSLREKTNFLNEGPYTVGLPEKGPDRFGQYLGFKMVTHFMDKNKNVTLQELVRTDYNTILQSYEVD